MRAYVNKDLCIGCGLCESICPEVFKMNDDGKAGAVVDELSKDRQNEAEDARSQCPVDAITIEK